MCGLADQWRVHKQKVVGSSPVMVNVLCPWVRHFTIILLSTQVYKWVLTMLGRQQACCWLKRAPHYWFWPIRFEKEGDIRHPDLCLQVESLPIPYTVCYMVVYIEIISKFLDLIINKRPLSPGCFCRDRGTPNWPEEDRWVIKGGCRILSRGCDNF